MARLGYVPALDGLRGVAIALVVAYHVLGWPRGGWLGVDLFFVLSGFLITTLLLEERAESGRIRLRAFYARRARRLLPALAVLLAAYLAIDACRGEDALGLVGRWGLYGGNVYEAFWPGAAVHLVGLNHLWSLAQEEQFYLVWPAALLAARRARNPVAVLALLATALIAYRAALILAGASGIRVYFAPDTNLDGLVLGSALAFGRRRRPLAVPRPLVAGAAVLAVPLVLLFPPLGVTNIAVLPLFELAAVVLVAAAAASSLRLPSLLIRLGGISYSLYLWHFVIFWALHWHHRLAVLVLSVAAAYASTRWVERPFRRRRHEIPNRRSASLVLPLGRPKAAAALAATAGAGGNPSGTGQPSQTCLSSTAPTEPGHAALASGSAFNETGPGTAGTVYAGNGVSAKTPANGAAVSQYDVACYQVSQPH